MRRRTAIAAAEWAAVLLLAWLFVRTLPVYTGSRTPEEAHRLSEKSFHYGPTAVARKVVAPFDKDQVVFLGTYKAWFSADTVKRRHGGWVPGDGVGGVEIDRSKPLTYSWSGSATHDRLMAFKFYGYVSDDRIAAIELVMTGKKSGNMASMHAPIGKDRMFLFLWEADNGNNGEWQSVLGLDASGKLVYEAKLR
ncbi:hypothetical protein SAMN02799624_05529 [Paenibacillus sp. UNC496MF]|uniref:hypothetical protein n=1 Tax=Paenibacillus sp. UNC496MF TaxID=1502753 RepID=UPI0008F26501|nr:hypothetical protein [Paenibacillus sp. UNC496MF]SFJ69343.1 hypothetical protein SAMN02799624_05529 [Paenibacillus sp. UNC496MF]